MATLKKKKIVFKTDYSLMQVKSIAECSKRDHSAILSTFIKLPVVIKTFFYSLVSFYTCFTVFICMGKSIRIFIFPDKQNDQKEFSVAHSCLVALEYLGYNLVQL